MRTLIGAAVAALALTALALAGTDAGARERQKVTVKPAELSSGEQLTVRGRGFKPERRLTLLIGPPRSEAVKVGATRTDSEGRFRRRLAVKGEPARYVLLACQRSCAIKDRDSFFIVAH